MTKIIYVESNKKKEICPICNEYTKSIHDKLKPIELKYLKIVEYDCKINIIKKRFVCHKCNKRFTENLDLNQKGKTVSNKLEQKILKDLLNYNLSIKYIAKDNNVNLGTVRNTLKNAMSEYPEHIINLPKVISFDEFKADTIEGKYAFILNDPIHRKALDILPSRKKEYLNQYFTYCENRHSVEYVISDMYDPYLLVTQIMFPKAKYVVDRFHYTRYIMDGLDKIRIRLQKSYDIEEMTEAAKTIENWLPYIVNSFIDKRFSNGFTEGLKNKIKVVKRVAFGYKNFKFFRLRLMYILNVKVSGMSKKDRNRKK